MQFVTVHKPDPPKKCETSGSTWNKRLIILNLHKNVFMFYIHSALLLPYSTGHTSGSCGNNTEDCWLLLCDAMQSVRCTDMSEDPAASCTRVDPTISILVYDYMASQPHRQQSSCYTTLLLHHFNSSDDKTLFLTALLDRLMEMKSNHTKSTLVGITSYPTYHACTNNQQKSYST